MKNQKPNYDQFRKNLKVLRRVSGISATYLEKKLRFTKCRIPNLELGICTTPRTHEITALAAFFNVTENELMHGYLVPAYKAVSAEEYARIKLYQLEKQHTGNKHNNAGGARGETHAEQLATAN
jgi:transcriptional regulator with XRE-family HTH domain